MANEQVREFSARGFSVETIDTSGPMTNMPRWQVRVNRLARGMRVAGGVMRKIRLSDIVFIIIAPQSVLIMTLFLWCICKIFRRLLVVRPTGSLMVNVYRGYGPMKRWLANHTLMRSDIVYLETKHAMRSFGSPPNFRWFPNTRNIHAAFTMRRDRVNKLIFLAQLYIGKGLREAVEACRNLPENCHLYVFGPGTPETDFSIFDDHPRATYCGVLEPEKVPQTLSEHDLLLFPSYLMEGYPGSILEAFQCGVPVIATNWGSLPEIVEHEENGLLVEPRSSAAIESAIERLRANPELYQRLCEGAKRQGERFRSTNWYDQAASDLRSLCLK